MVYQVSFYCTQSYINVLVQTASYYQFHAFMLQFVHNNSCTLFPCKRNLLSDVKQVKVLNSITRTYSTKHRNGMKTDCGRRRKTRKCPERYEFCLVVSSSPRAHVMLCSHANVAPGYTLQDVGVSKEETSTSRKQSSS